MKYPDITDVAQREGASDRVLGTTAPVVYGLVISVYFGLCVFVVLLLIDNFTGEVQCSPAFK